MKTKYVIFKKRMLIVALFLLTGSLFMLAQPPERGPDPNFDPEERAERIDKLAEDLELNDEQVQKIKEFEKIHMEKAKTLRKEVESNRKENRKEMKALQEERMEAMKEILTEDQFSEFEELRGDHKRPRRKRPGKRRH